MNEDINTVSPTLGFIIKAIDYGESVDLFPIRGINVDYLCADIDLTFVRDRHSCYQHISTYELEANQ